VRTYRISLFFQTILSQCRLGLEFYGVRRLSATRCLFVKESSHGIRDMVQNTENISCGIKFKKKQHICTANLLGKVLSAL
jgi:hypothetical protein